MSGTGGFYSSSSGDSMRPSPLFSVFLVALQSGKLTPPTLLSKGEKEVLICHVKGKALYPPPF